MTFTEALETTPIYRFAGRTDDRMALLTTRPCCAPHHTGLACEAERNPRLRHTPGSTPPVPCYGSMTPRRRRNIPYKQTAPLGEPCCTTNPWLGKRFTWCRLI